MKLKLIALAAMLAASGVAQAKIADSNDNGNLSSGDMFASLVSKSSSTSYTVDLGLTLDQFKNTIAPTQTGVKLVWDLDNNSFSDLSSVATGLAGQMQTLNYGSVYSNFAATGATGASDLMFDVKAMDGLPTSFPAAGTNRYLSTSYATSITPTNGQVFAMDNVDGYPTAANGDLTNSTHGTSLLSAGANMFDAGDGYNVYFENGSKHNWNGATSFTTTTSVSKDLNFYFLTNSSTNTASLASVTKYAGVWSFDTATAQLSYTAAAPVPVPAAVWLLGSGLIGMVGVARRKKAA